MRILNSLLANKYLLSVIVGTSLIFIIGQVFQNAFLFNRTAIDQGNWWQIISGNFTHSNYSHLALNLSGLWIFFLLFFDSISSRTFLISCCALSLIVGFGLYIFNPELHYYYGFSGVLYGLFFIGAISSILSKDYFTGISVAILITAKIVMDYFTGGNQSSAELIGVPVANDAHLYGFMGAFLISTFLVSKWLFIDEKRHPPPF